MPKGAELEQRRISDLAYAVADSMLTNSAAPREKLNHLIDEVESYIEKYSLKDNPRKDLEWIIQVLRTQPTPNSKLVQKLAEVMFSSHNHDHNRIDDVRPRISKM